jgi:hypothetical protein
MGYDDNNPLHRKQVFEYLTRPNRVFTSNSKNKSNTDQLSTQLNKSNNKSPSKKEFDAVGKVMMNSYKYDEANNGTEREIRNYIIKKIDSGQQLDSDEVRFMMDTKGSDYSRQVTLKQTDNVKNIETQKPFKQSQKFLKPEPTKPVSYIPDPRSKKIDEDLKALNIITEPKPTFEEIIREQSKQRLKKEQEEHDKQFGRGGLPELVRPV